MTLRMVCSCPSWLNTINDSRTSNDNLDLRLVTFQSAVDIDIKISNHERTLTDSLSSDFNSKLSIAQRVAISNNAIVDKSLFDLKSTEEKQIDERNAEMSQLDMKLSYAEKSWHH